MKKSNFKLLLLVAVLPIFMYSCEKEENAPAYLTDTYIINYGNYTGSKSTISSLDADKDTVYHNVYSTVNEVEILSNVQNVGVNNGKIYMMSNDGDKIDIVNASDFKATINPISKDITKPRFVVFDDQTAFVSCWGEVADWTKLNNSYIAKIDLNTNKVTEQIALPGGPEGLAIANGKLYAALNYADSIAVVKLSDLSVSYIETPAVASYFLNDDAQNLYVSLVSTYSDPSFESGIGYINTQTDVLVSNTTLDGISSNYGSIMQFNADKSKIYIIASSWVEEPAGTWVQKGAINTFDVAANAFDAEPFLSGLTGINGISIDKDDNMYCFFADGVTFEGTLKIYSAQGNLKSTYSTGLSPIMALFVE